MVGPPQAKRPATRKKRAEREMAEARRKMGKLIRKTPAVMVMTL